LWEPPAVVDDERPAKASSSSIMNTKGALLCRASERALLRINEFEWNVLMVVEVALPAPMKLVWLAPGWGGLVVGK